MIHKGSDVACMVKMPRYGTHKQFKVDIEIE